MRRIGVLAVVAALAVTLAGGTLGGGVGSVAVAKKHKKHKKKKPKPVRWASQLTLSLTTPTHFEGTVSSKLGACRNQRYVIVYFGDPDSGEVKPLSVQRTDAGGHYQVDLPKPAFRGSYAAQVAEERIKANKAPQICEYASSPSVTVSG